MMAMTSQDAAGAGLRPLASACSWALLHLLGAGAAAFALSSRCQEGAQPSRHGAWERVLRSEKALTLWKWPCWPRPLRPVLFPLKSSAGLGSGPAPVRPGSGIHGEQSVALTLSRQPAGAGRDRVPPPLADSKPLKDAGEKAQAGSPLSGCRALSLAPGPASLMTTLT